MPNSNSNIDFSNYPEFDNHSLVSRIEDPKTGLKGFIAFHRMDKKAPAFGATRIWKYDSEASALRDVLRLSKIMSYKAALAGLKCTGAKGIIMDNGFSDRKAVLESYVEKVNYFQGEFITGADVGINNDDLKVMRDKSSNIVGFEGDPVNSTALGIYSGIEASLKEKFGDESFQGKTFAIQGLGKVGHLLLEMIAPKAEKVYVSDIDEKKLGDIVSNFSNVSVVDSEKMYSLDVDVFCPCALSYSLNSKTVPLLNCKIIAGGANNQLENENIGVLLHKLGILYAPDYCLNAGGLLSVFSEYKKKSKFSEKKVNEKALKIKKTLQKIFNESKKENKPTNIIADEMAVKIIKKNFKNDGEN